MPALTAVNVSAGGVDTHKVAMSAGYLRIPPNGVPIPLLDG